MYPDKTFLKEHFDIVDKYRDEIMLYKGSCYKELNTYFKTGKVILQGDCNPQDLEDFANRVGKPGLTTTEQVELISKRLEDLYEKVKPLPHDIIIYRGIHSGTVGQNLFSGDCIKSRLYDLDSHRFCSDQDLKDIPLFENRKNNESPDPYIMETLGFVSTTTSISTALRFARKDNEYDTVMALRLPAGTKFIIPANAEGLDYEFELILFPKQSTFIINNLVETYESAILGNKYPVYVGSFCNDLNKYRPATSPKLRDLRVSLLNVYSWYNEHSQNKPLLTVNNNRCQSGLCNNYLHFCNPIDGKCLSDKPQNIKTIQKWWRTNNIKGKCTKKKVNECVDKFQACDPHSGECLKPDSAFDYGFATYSNLVNRRVLDWVTSQQIIDSQKPRYNCSKDKIKQCATTEPVAQLCDPFSVGCMSYNANNLWMVNNNLDPTEQYSFGPVGKCTEQNIRKCADNALFCDPETAECKTFEPANELALNDLIVGQKKKRPAYTH